MWLAITIDSRRGGHKEEKNASDRAYYIIILAIRRKRMPLIGLTILAIRRKRMPLIGPIIVLIEKRKMLLIGMPIEQM